MIIRKFKYSLIALLISFYFFLMPFDLFKISETSTLLKGYAIILVIVSIFYHAKQRFNIFLDKLILLILLYAIICGFSIIYSINVSSSISTFTSIAMNIGLILFCSTVNYQKHEITLMENALFAAGILCIVMTFIFSDFSDGGRLSISILGDTADQNYLNGYVFFLIGLSVNKILTKSNYWIFYLLSCLLAIFFTLYTGSRGALLAELIIIFINLIIHFKKSNKKLIWFILSGLFIILLISSFNFLLTLLPPHISLRFSKEYITLSGTSQRTVIWFTLIERFINDTFITWLFGKGIGTSATYNMLDGRVAHNVFIDILIGVGIVGLIVYINIFVRSIIYTLKFEKYALTSILFGFVFFSMSLSLITYKPIFNTLLLVQIYYVYYRNKVKSSLLYSKYIE